MNNWGTEKHSFGRWLLCILTALILTACGGGDDELPLAPSTGTGTTPPVVTPSTALSFFEPVDSAEIEVSTSEPVGVIYLDSAGAPKAGETIFFTASRGTLSPTSAVTDASGKASVTLSSPSAGLASIKANTPGGSQIARRTVLFVSTTPASISVQAELTTLATGGSTAVIATVRDSSGNPVKGKIVEFSANSASSGGNLSDTTATTDAAGKASVTYTAGSSATATDGIAIRASVQGTSITTSDTTAPLDVKLTVSGPAMFISITSTNTISEQSNTHYALPFGIQVTSAGGIASSGAVVTLSVTPLEYYKGQYVWNGTNAWEAVSSAGDCPNEDTDLDGVLDSGEDFNGSGILEPGSPVSVPAPVTTDSSGLASFSLVYGKNFAYWVKVRLKATAVVAGTESVKTEDLVVPAMSSDVNTQTKSPPGGGYSPFGIAANCDDRN